MKLLIFAILAIPSYAIPAHQLRGDAVAVGDGLSSMTERAPCAASDDPQSSLTLCPDLIQTGYSQDGQNPPVPAGQDPSLTSSNNFINFCLTVPNLPLTNGKQITSGSCNASPQGVLAATTNMPSSKFTNPANLDTLKANTTFDITMAISHLQAGNFVNAQTNYYAAPQQVDSNGDIIGHSHFVIEKLTGIKQVTPTSPGSFVFFKGVNTPAPKTYPPTDPECQLSPLVSPIRYAIIRNIIRSANIFGMASLVALEKISSEVKELRLKDYIDIVTLASLSVRARNLSDNAWLVQEILLVLDETRRPLRNSSSAQDYIHQHVLAVAFDLAEEAAEECPCDIKGNILRNKRPGIAPTRAPLIRCQDKPHQVIAHVRVDAPSSLRLHSHVRLQAASKPERVFIERAVLDGLVVGASKGELTIEVLQPLPPEFDKMEWNLYNAGSVATSRAMFDALLRLGSDQSECCRFYGIITSGKEPHHSHPSSTSIDNGADAFYEVANDKLNESQIAAVTSTGSPLTLIWGPPGTGKTTVVIEILRKFLRERSGDSKILMTASTHNAVDNVLERFVADHILENNQMLRVATDYTKVSKHLQAFTIDARVGGDVNQNERLKKEAEKRVKEAVIIFTTVTGAGLGTLRHVDFDIVLIDEASQVTEPCALIPLVKGCKKAVLVGDHVQLRPTVRPMGKALQYDVSLLERLYTGREHHQMARAMLDIQYRFPEGLARFPSQKFYQGRLRTGVQNAGQKLQLLERTGFPWPKDDTGRVIPTVFVPCDSQEDFGGSSKANIGQVQLVGHIAKLLSEPSAGSELPDISVTALTPYSKQTRELRNLSLAAFTIDSFQGRESDVIILSTVRCNDTGDIGFVEDERRLNVAWTRAKLGLIIVGNRNTLQSSLLWREAIESCREISVTAPET